MKEQSVAQKKKWTVPKIFDLRLGMEITMYVFNKAFKSKSK